MQPTTVHKTEKNISDKIVESALSIFARKGLSQTTLREIAEQASVSLSVIQYHFRTKEKLYAHCISTTAQKRLEIVQAILKEPATYEEFKQQFRNYILNYFDSLVKDRDYHRILFFETERPSLIAEQVLSDYILPVFLAMKSFIEAAKRKGFVHAHIDSYVAAEAIYGILSNYSKGEYIRRSFFGIDMQDSEYREILVKHLLRFIHQGISTRSIHS